MVHSESLVMKQIRIAFVQCPIIYLKSLRRNKIIPEDYGLPKAARKLPKIPDHKFKEFLKVLIENNDLEIRTMRQWIMEAIQQ